MLRCYASFQSRVVIQLAALCCLLLLPAALHAQRSPASAERAREREMQDREYALYHAGEPREKTETPTPPRNVLPQVRADFRQLQLINNGLMQQVVVAKTLDYRLIAQALGDINKRAERLKENLALPQLQVTEDSARKDKAQVVPSDAAQLKTALFELDRVIMRFVTNPQFSSVSTLAVPHVDQAGCDLRDIIELSRALRKSAQQLGK